MDELFVFSFWVILKSISVWLNISLVHDQSSFVTFYLVIPLVDSLCVPAAFFIICSNAILLLQIQHYEFKLQNLKNTTVYRRPTKLNHKNIVLYMSIWTSSDCDTLQMWSFFFYLFISLYYVLITFWVKKKCSNIFAALV